MSDYFITFDRDRIDLDVVHRYLSRESYWAANIPREIVEVSIRNSLCVSAFWGDAQVGFARVVTDYATFGYLADVFVVEAHRGRGISKRIVEAVITHPSLANLRRWMLVTRDAHGLYEQYGFRSLAHPERHMEIARANAYGGEKPAQGS
ncbi:MAG: GNAT family N-acetyltransferase [Thermoanaerobaculia bacterium]